MNTYIRTVVSALIFSKDKHLLMGRKDPNSGGMYADCWHIPGGSLNNNEVPIDGLKREIFEETGIDITPYPVRLVDDKGHDIAERILRETGERAKLDMTFYVYEIQLDKLSEDITISPNDDLVAFRWVPIEELKTIKHTPPSITLFKRLGYLQ
jgi:ADP-ribose pyrophosphatase YjhB (NUDIX family)